MRDLEIIVPPDCVAAAKMEHHQRALEHMKRVNGTRATPFRIDYSYDAPRHPLNRYCRSDHYNYARRGIPITYFSRGYHEAYHMVTDESQYIDFEGLVEVAGLVRDVARAIANRDERLVVDKPTMNPRAPCLQ